MKSDRVMEWLDDGFKKAGFTLKNDRYLATARERLDIFVNVD